MSPVDAAVIIARLVQFSAAAVLGGGALFFLYGVAPDARATWPTRLIATAAGAGALGAIGWLMAQSGQIGSGPADAFDPATVWSVATETGFGRVALARLAFFLCALFLAIGLKSGRRLWLYLGITGAAASASFAWTGHGARDGGLAGSIHLAADVLHLLAGSIWIGALAVLTILVCRASRAGAGGGGGQDALTGLVRFSAIGLGVVGVLVASGLVNGWLLVGPTGLRRVLTTPYGLLLLTKLVLFGMMLALAALNRYRLIPQLEPALRADSGPKSFEPVVRSILAETALAILVLGLVSWLGTLSPPIDG